MRFMFIVKATGYSEAGVNYSREHNDAMIAYKKSLASAGVLISAEELHPSSTGIRIMHPSDSGWPEILAGPFPVDQELIAEYILIDVNSEDEAFNLALRMPVPGRDECKIEVRKLKENQGFLRDSGTLVMEADLENQLNMLKKI
ncbi:YciI family protein [Bacillus sp. BRMEA1]|uniref:YciI family protein n=1 Tax=Neobacillus endophyticus TaxID=2738405 RepID=UPI001563F685|nr:YciI family protein [Neobacillus endophyticus]NRD79877.1 YciI family protein [Neobacillus endophyticus]